MEGETHVIEIGARTILLVVVLAIACVGLVSLPRVHSAIIYRRYVQQLKKEGSDLHDEFSWWLYKAGHPNIYNEYNRVSWKEFINKIDSSKDVYSKPIKVYLDTKAKTIWFRIPSGEYTGVIYYFEAQVISLGFIKGSV